MNRDCICYQLVALVNMYRIITRHVSTIDISNLQGVPVLKDSIWY